MTDHPITPDRLREYAETKGDSLDGLRVDERAFLEACAWEWEKAREAKPADESPRSLYAKLMQQSNPAAPEKPACEPVFFDIDGLVADLVKRGNPPVTDSITVARIRGIVEKYIRPAVQAAPSSPAAGSACEQSGPDYTNAGVTAAESADEGLEATQDDIEMVELGVDYGCRCTMGGNVCQSCRERVKRVARVALRALRRGGVTEAMRKAIGAKFTNRAGDASEGVALSWWNATRPRYLEIGYESVEAAKAAQSAIATARDEIAALDSGASVVVDREEWDRLRSQPELQPTVDALAAKLAEAERERDYYKHEHKQADESLCEMALIAEERKRALRGMDDALATARAEAERLRGERDIAEANNRLAQAALAATAAPTVAVTDVETFLSEWYGDDDGTRMAQTKERAREGLRKHTRAASVEEVARGIEDTLSRDGRARRNASDIRLIVEHALRALGVREAEKNATPPPAPGWTDAQLDAAWDFHLRTRGYTIDIRASREMICGQLAEIAPLFAPKVRVKLPDERRGDRYSDMGFNQCRDECAAALRSAGVEIEGEQ